MCTTPYELRTIPYPKTPLSENVRFPFNTFLDDCPSLYVIRMSKQIR